MSTYFSFRWAKRSGAFFGTLLIAFMAAGLSEPARADIRLVIANDFLASNELNDDLYTGTFAVDYTLGRYLLTGGENIFTDTQSGIRFDESYLTIGRAIPSFAGWQPRVEVGLVHIGCGLLGERAQNAIHRLIGDDEVHLDYVDGSRLYPSFRLSASRPLPFLRRYALALHADVASAIGFKDHAFATVSASIPVHRDVRIDLDVGARYSHSSFDALAPRIRDWGPTWEAGLTLRERVSFSWNYNHFGTGSQHFNVVYRIRWGRAKKPSHDGIERALAQSVAAQAPDEHPFFVNHRQAR